MLSEEKPFFASTLSTPRAPLDNYANHLFAANSSIFTSSQRNNSNTYKSTMPSPGSQLNQNSTNNSHQSAMAAAAAAAAAVSYPSSFNPFMFALHHQQQQLQQLQQQQRSTQHSNVFPTDFSSLYLAPFANLAAGNRAGSAQQNNQLAAAAAALYNQSMFMRGSTNPSNPQHTNNPLLASIGSSLSASSSSSSSSASSLSDAQDIWNHHQQLAAAAAAAAMYGQLNSASTLHNTPPNSNTSQSKPGKSSSSSSTTSSNANPNPNANVPLNLIKEECKDHFSKSNGKENNTNGFTLSQYQDNTAAESATTSSNTNANLSGHVNTSKTTSSAKSSQQFVDALAAAALLMKTTPVNGASLIQQQQQHQQLQKGLKAKAAKEPKPKELKKQKKLASIIAAAAANSATGVSPGDFATGANAEFLKNISQMIMLNQQAQQQQQNLHSHPSNEMLSLPLLSASSLSSASSTKPLTSPATSVKLEEGVVLQQQQRKPHKVKRQPTWVIITKRLIQIRFSFGICFPYALI